MKPDHITLEQAMAKIPRPNNERYASIFEDGDIEMEIYAPRGNDPQKPHTRDEIYIVMKGQGTFLNGEKQQPFGTGDFLFVPAGVKHRFENFSEDLIVWAFFYKSK